MGIDARARRLVLAAAAMGLSLSPALAQDAPMSAIDWLSQSVTAAPQAASLPAGPSPDAVEEPEVTTGAVPADVAVTVLGAPAPDAVGLLSSDRSGLPRNLWGLGATEEIAAAISADRADILPTLQSLMVTLLLAEAEAPPDAGGRGILLLARIDRLLAMGALDQAAALIEATNSVTVDLFRRQFDVALLTGTEDRACETMRTAPNLAPTFPARIFCLARAGDWTAAALTLRTAQALGQIDRQEEELLSRFLDPEAYDGEAPLLPPSRPTPLIWRLYDAIGETLPTTSLPVAFANAELTDRAGWKAQIEAAERLTRAGALTPNTLLGVYTERLPAASGGVWDRVEAFQRFDTALRAADPGAVARTLPDAWARMEEAELETAFAGLFAEDLIRLPLTGETAALAFRIALLSPHYERAANTHKPSDLTETFLAGLARGQLQGITPPDSMARAIAPAFLRPAPPPEAEALLAESRLGETILLAIDRIGNGVRGDLRGVSEGLSILRHIGLEDAARRTALELLLLERRG
ncbi:hypothetical protein [Aliigemmobacter aestuarii]|nr:hypothetical protein [Gemmobacter aestuarii]